MKRFCGFALALLLLCLTAIPARADVFFTFGGNIGDIGAINEEGDNLFFWMHSDLYEGEPYHNEPGVLEILGDGPMYSKWHTDPSTTAYMPMWYNSPARGAAEILASRAR